MTEKKPLVRWSAALLGLIIALVGLALLGGGVYLIALGGSWYFALAGLGMLASGVLLVRQRREGAWLYLLVFAASILWSLWDVGFSFWPLVSRLVALGVVAFLVLLVLPSLREDRSIPAGRGSYAAAIVVALALVATIGSAFQPIAQVAASGPPPASSVGKAVGADQGTEWHHYGRTPSGTRFAPIDQITPANVNQLEVAWTYRTGEIPKGAEGHVVTPLQIGNMVYGCTQSSTLFALDAETGAEKWRFDPKAKPNTFPRCRGVSTYQVPAAAASAGATAASAAPAPAAPVPATATTSAASAACARRIVSTTVDARLVEVDALTGLPCADFGDNGIVDLKVGMGNIKPGYYFQTSAPTVMNDLIVVGGWVNDNQEIEEPSGVIRAFNAVTGKLVWAWDMGNPALTGLPPDGQGYTRGTPNVWTTPAFDAALGLIYLPTGNSTPDFWGGKRTQASEDYTASVVALDINTGRERWKFQTVHHDLWDYDLPSQPALYDIPDQKGGTVPALIQTTKRGEIFVLDRRTGTPVTPVEERPVPQGAAAGDRTSPTQPYSVGMPSFGKGPLSESQMWGVSPVDQLICRIGFRQMRYEGEFTPPGITPALQYPGFGGGMNWGSTSVVENKGYLIVNDMRIGIQTQLIPRAEYDAAAAAGQTHGGSSAQGGTPFGVRLTRFMSPIGIPCQAPPYGTISAIDLATKKIVWEMPIGTVQDTGPLGISMHLKIPVGLPTLGGPMSTSSGLIFMAGTQDKYIRAIDVADGKELWKGRLPVVGETTPMTYLSPASGRQFVVVTAGGGRSTVEKGDYIIAYALPKTK